MDELGFQPAPTEPLERIWTSVYGFLNRARRFEPSPAGALPGAPRKARSAAPARRPPRTHDIPRFEWRLAFIAARSTASQAFAHCHLFPSWAQLPETINVNGWIALEANPVPALSVTW